MRILSIETSCDETGVSIVEATGGLSKPRLKILANITASQVLLHAQYGGVFPMMAKREHAKNLTPILEQVLKDAHLLKLQSTKFHSQILENLRMKLKREPELSEALIPLLQKIKKPKIDAIAVTYGPGLEPTLWVGINFAKALSLAWNIPVVPINHMEGHIFSGLMTQKKYASQKLKVKGRRSGNSLQPTTYNLQPIRFPSLALLISGGHTELVLMKGWFKYKIVGETLDDAVGEAFDKVARMLNLPYPGGPQISALAKFARKNAERTQNVAEINTKNAGKILRKSALRPRESALRLPRPMINSGDLNFSFSGLKTAVLYTLKKVPKITESVKADIAREFENSATEVLVEKTLTALKKYKAKTLILGGGVSANEKIRGDMKRAVGENFPDCALYLPDPSLTGDNAIMIAGATYLRLWGARAGKTKLVSNFSAKGNLRL